MAKNSLRKFLFLLLLSTLLRAGDFAIVGGRKATPLEQLASRELKRYLFLLSGEEIPIIREDSANRFSNLFILGTPETNSTIARYLKEKGININSLPEEGFLLKTSKQKGKSLILIAGKTPIAVLYGVYTLLEDGYDVLFTLADDFLPPKKPLRIPEIDKIYKPAFSIRGTLPWFNFFDSPTAWNLVDYKFYIDQLSKQKLNFLGFHAYDFEPFCAHPWKGKLVKGEPLANTSQPNWGTHPMRTTEFAFGTDAYFSDEYFGADASLNYKTREEGIEKAQKLLREALKYAKSKGIKVCLGFEVTGDPTDPNEQEMLKARIQHLLKTYPFLDYIWIWEPEGMGINGCEPPSLRSPLGSYYRRWEPYFSYLNEPRRIAEAVRMSLYVLLAHRFIKNIAPDVKLIVSGWGGDRWLHFSDFYPGMDKILPKDIIFSALDNINPTDDVASAYGQLSPERQRWPIPWFEFDGDQWFPQPWNLRYEKLMRDALRKGCQGILAIHWRTREIEETCSFFSQFCWRPGLTFKGFYDHYAECLIGKEKGNELSDILQELQRLGYRWIGGAGQPECGGFGWSAGEPGKMEKLKRLKERLEELKGQLIRAGREEAGRRLDYYINTAEWALLYHQTADAMLSLNPLLSKLREARLRGDIAGAKALAEQALIILPIQTFSRALNIYASNIASRGELGVLATINAKAFWDFREKLKEIEGVLGRKIDLPKVQAKGLKLILPSNPSTISPGEEISLPLIVLSDEPVEITLHYRQVGSRKWGKTIVKERKRNTYFVPLPKLKRGEILLWFLEVKGASSVHFLPKEEAEGPFALSIWEVPPIKELKERSDIYPPSPPASPKADKGIFSLQLSWREGKDDVGIDHYEVHRSGEGAERTFLIRDNWFEDFSIKPEQTYTYKIYSVDVAGKKSGRFSELKLKVPSFHPPEPPKRLRGEPLPGGVKLVWEKASPDIIGYRIERNEEGEFAPVKGAESIPPNYFGNNVYRLQDKPGQAIQYRVRAISPLGDLSEPSSSVSIVPLPKITQPFFSASYEGTLKAEPAGEGAPNGTPVFAEEGIGRSLYLSEGRWVYYPPREEFNPQFELSIELWAKILSTEGMPILIGHGIWREDGYFLQVLGGQFRFSIAGVGDFDSGYRPHLNQWLYICATYDGTSFHLYINGSEVAIRKAEGLPIPSNAPLYIGRYEIPDSVYFFNGYIDEVRLYPYALTRDEVRAHYEKEIQLLRR